MKNPATAEDNPKTNWHSGSAQSVIDILNSSENGLSDTEAQKRFLESGPNALPEEKVPGILKIFLYQFKSPLLYILMFAAALVSVIGEITDGVIIAAALLINAIIGVVQEGKARNTLKSLRDFSKSRAVVIRNGIEKEIDDRELVRGDIFIIRSGDKIGADGRIINSQSLKVNEPALTGESEPAEKNASELPEDTEVPSRMNMVYKGSFAVSGQAKAIVVETGSNTIIGNISKILKTIDSEVPLKKKMAGLSKFIGLAVLGAAIFVFVLGLSKGISITEIFFTTTAISVSIIPEGLPVVITLILARGVYRMAKRNALVKNMQAVEALGQTNILAVDKTGTITKNELMIERVFVDNKDFVVLGSGYSPRGEILQNGQAVDPTNHPELLFSGKAATFCADASVKFLENGGVEVIGDPTEAALLVFGQKIGFNKDELEKEEPKIIDIPFSFEHKFHTTLHRAGENFSLTVVGAPEAILARIKNIWSLSGERKITSEDVVVINKKIEEFSADGLRVVCFATYTKNDPAINIEDISELCFGGILAMADVLREEVIGLVQTAQKNGIKTVMITGDFMDTAKAIAKKAGIWEQGDTVFKGADIAFLSKNELDRRLERVSVFGRVLPEHKLAIVESYKRRGQIVGMTGDGVNDALSLSAADLGIAMGIGGTEVAKEAADIVLLDNNFKSILAAIEEGRSIYKTIRKVVLYLISTSAGGFLTITGALILGLPLPIFPTQILWLNLVTDGFMVVSLAFEPIESLNGEKHKSKAIVGKDNLFRIFSMGTVMAIGSLFLFASAYFGGNPAAWTISLTVLAVYQWFNAWNCRSDKQSLFKKPFSNPYLVLGLLAAIFSHIFAVYNPFMQSILKTVPLSPKEWAVTIAVAASIIAVEEIRKLLARMREKV